MEAAAPYWREAYGLAWALTGDRGRAEELAQEAFVRLGTMKREPDATRPLRELLLAIVRNLALDELRRQGASSLDEAMDGGASFADASSPDPAAEVQARERRERLREALDTLSPTWRATLYLRDGLSLSYRQIAEVLERSEDVVRVTLHRARLSLRELVEARIAGGEPS